VQFPEENASSKHEIPCFPNRHDLSVWESKTFSSAKKSGKEFTAAFARFPIMCENFKAQFRFAGRKCGFSQSSALTNTALSGSGRKRICAESQP